MEEQEYINGFNRGYLIAKHEPELAAKLAATQNQHPFFEGLIDGKNQYEKEVREWSQSFGRDSGINGNDKDRNTGFER